MYKRSSSYLISNDINPLRYIENTELAGLDLANSTLLYMIDNETEYEQYTVTRYERRIDLIAQEVYGNTNYSWLLMYINRIDVNDIVRGVKLNYIPYTRLEAILSMI